MSIDRMQRVTILAPRRSAGTLVERLQELGLIHLEDACGRLRARGGDTAPTGSPPGGDKAVPSPPALSSPALSSEAVDAKVRQLEAIQHVLDTFAPVKKSFVQGLVSTPMRVKRAEMAQVVEQFDHEPLYFESMHALEELRDRERAIEAAEAEIAALELFRVLPFEPGDLLSLRLAHAWLGSLPRRAWDELRSDEQATELLALQKLSEDKGTVRICAIALARDLEEAARILRQHEFSEQAVPELDSPLEERIGHLRGKVQTWREECESLKTRMRDLSQFRREVGILFGHWLAKRAKLDAHNSAAASRRIAVLCGYVRDVDTPALDQALASEFPEVSATYAEPTPEDAVPVSLTHSRLVKPIRFLVDMFGLPDYFSFDPTAYLSVSFLVFFGMCFGDVVYGLMLCALAGYLARKARGFQGLHNFCMLFLYCGVSTIIFGALSGSWAADLWSPEYLGEGNPLLWIKERTALIDPLEKAVVMLVVCLCIGIITQLYGIALKGYGLLRRGDVLGAVFDAGLWLIMIPSVLIVISPLFFATPQPLRRLALMLMLSAGVGLVLTQGRKEKGIFAKGITGLVSVYGILGSYGCVAFIGDMLSYSRLLALGLTTTIVGMSFNIIGGLVRQIPWGMGIMLFVLVLVVGHLFNFAVSIIGAFVHPARLIFLEFFGRFYQGGGVRFRPLSLNSERVVVE